MSDPENFIARWSRRKRSAADQDAEQPSASSEEAAREATVPDSEEQTAGVATPTPVEAREPSFDLTRLPSLDSITAESDIRAFLAPGVPAELTRAALRRAWVADPKIRNFVGLADYDWDYHAPGSMAGFGPLEMTDELRQLVARIVGGGAADDATSASSAPSVPSGSETVAQTSIESESRAANEADSSSQVVPKQLGIIQEEEAQYNREQHSHNELEQYDKEHAASQHGLQGCDNLHSTVRRLHGGALPK
jgi:hypothetical protein